MFISNETQWIEGLANDTQFFTFLEVEEGKGGDRFMGVEIKSDAFIGAYEMYASMSVLKSLIEELTLGTTASVWVYTNTQVEIFSYGRTGVYAHPVYQLENNDIVMTEELFA